MKYNIARCLILLVLILSIFPVAHGSAQSQDIFLFPEWVDSSNYPELVLHLSAWDAAGLPLKNLLKEQFSLQEDGGSPIQPLALQADTQAPLWVVLAIDTSRSMTGKPLEDARDAAARFLDRMGAQDQVALIAFSDSVNPDPGQLDPQKEMAFTTDREQLYELVENLQAVGQTPLYDAAAKAVRMFDQVPQGHRAILLLSDGRNEPADIGDPDLAIQLARQNRVPIFVIGLGRQIDLPYLQRLANETGGLFRAVPRSAELAELFTNAATLLKTQYQLSYRSALPADGKEHTLKVLLNANGSQNSASLPFGPLPLIPTSAPTSVPTASPTDTPLPSPTQPPPTATPLPPASTPAPTQAATATQTPSLLSNLGSNPLIWLAGALLVIGGAALFFLRRKSRSGGEVCAKCGYDLTDHSGACPQCGSTSRLPRP